MLLAQLTDTHIVGPANTVELYVDNNHRLTQAVNRLNAETVQPDAVLVTGDLTENGSAEEMELIAAELARLQAPVLAIPGNHDRRETFQDAFPVPAVDDASNDHLSWVTELSKGHSSLRIVGLDTVIPGEHGGAFDSVRADWLGRVLDEKPDQPTVIAMHHPPFASGIGWMDAYGFIGADKFAEVVSGRENVQRVFCGHLHRAITATVGGVTATVGLSTVAHIELNLAPNAPMEIVRDAPGYQLHNFDGAHWVSHNRHFATGEEPFAPS